MSELQMDPNPAPEKELPAPPANVLYRARAYYARQEALRYVSHLDMQQVWERTLRRAGVPLAYTQGFNPRPRLHMASALPLGFLSRCEIIDFWMSLPADAPAPADVPAPADAPAPEVSALAAQIQAAAPPGLVLTSLELVALKLAPLQTQVIAAEYTAIPYDPMPYEALAQAASALLEQPALPRERRGKPYDLRQLVEALQAVPAAAPAASARLEMRLTAREGATGRPEEVLDALGLDAAAFRVERTALILKEETE